MAPTYWRVLALGLRTPCRDVIPAAGGQPSSCRDFRSGPVPCRPRRRRRATHMGPWPAPIARPRPRKSAVSSRTPPGWSDSNVPRRTPGWPASPPPQPRARRWWHLWRGGPAQHTWRRCRDEWRQVVGLAGRGGQGNPPRRDRDARRQDESAVATGRYRNGQLTTSGVFLSVSSPAASAFLTFSYEVMSLGVAESLQVIATTAHSGG